MLADELDYVVGVDPHRDVHALAVVEVRTGGLVFEAAIAANTNGHRRALELAQRHASRRRTIDVPVARISDDPRLPLGVALSHTVVLCRDDFLGSPLVHRSDASPRFASGSSPAPRTCDRRVTVL